MFNLKTMKSSSQPNSSTPPQHPKHSKLISLPLMRIKAKETSSQRRRLTVYGYKYFSKIAAIGEETPEVLCHLKHLSTIKLVKHFEFDPYLCEESGLSMLAQVLNKLKRGMTRMNMVIRRIEKPHETDKIIPCLYKISQLEKLRLELVNAKGVTEEDLKTISKALTKCYNLRALNLQIVYVPNIGQNGVKQFVERFGKIRKLEDLRFLPFVKYSPQNEFKDIFILMPKLQVTNFFTKSSSQNGWTSMTGDTGQFLPKYINSFADSLNPQKFTYILHKLPVSVTAMTTLSQIFARMSNTREVFLEFYNCKLGDLELMVLADGLKDATQIERFTLKFVEYSFLEPEFLVDFVGFISQFSFLKRFDLFFRKLKYSNNEASFLLEQLGRIENTTSVLSKESLHVQRNLEN